MSATVFEREFQIGEYKNLIDAGICSAAISTYTCVYVKSVYYTLGSVFYECLD